MDNYGSNNNNYNYANEGYGAFNVLPDSQQNSYYYNDGYQEPTGFAGIKTIATEKAITKAFVFMTFALIITAIASMITSPMTAINMMTGGTFYILLIAELAIVFAGNAAVKKNNAVLAAVLYTVYSFLTGMTLSVIYVAYTLSSLAAVFFITAGMFAVMAVIGLATKKNLSGIGSACMMALIGIIIASIVNMFILHSSMLEFGVSILGVVIFSGLTAYDTQKIKKMAAYSSNVTENSLALFGAFELYLDFINLFLRLLSILGRRK